MQPIPRDCNDNGIVTMLVYHNKPALLLTVHQHGGDDVTCIRSISYLYYLSQHAILVFKSDIRVERFLWTVINVRLGLFISFKNDPTPIHGKHDRNSDFSVSLRLLLILKHNCAANDVTSTGNCITYTEQHSLLYFVDLTLTFSRLQKRQHSK